MEELSPSQRMYSGVRTKSMNCISKIGTEMNTATHFTEDVSYKLRNLQHNKPTELINNNQMVNNQPLSMKRGIMQRFIAQGGRIDTIRPPMRRINSNDHVLRSPNSTVVNKIQKELREDQDRELELKNMQVQTADSGVSSDISDEIGKSTESLMDENRSGVSSVMSGSVEELDYTSDQAQRRSSLGFCQSLQRTKSLVNVWEQRIKRHSELSLNTMKTKKDFEF